MVTRPRTKTEKDMLKWHLHFDTVKVFIRNRRWYALIKGKCIYLDKKNKCTIYKKRSDLCRSHMPPECERYGKWYDKIISAPVELDRYLNKNKKKTYSMKKHITAFFLFIITVSTTGCTIPSFLSGKTSTQTSCSKQIAHHERKWVFVGKISKKHPNPMRVLMIQTESMGEALNIMKENSDKYSTKYFRSLPPGTSIYISKNNELFINKEGGAAPDETVTTYTTIDNCKKKAPPRYLSPENKDVNLSEIKEEDLTE